jgi:predicted transposase YbfD/YdcC
LADEVSAEFTGRRVLTVTDQCIAFPHAAQVVCHRIDTKSGNKQSRETVYGSTDLTSRQASPERIAKILRAQWVIDNRLLFARDAPFSEGPLEIRTGHSLANMATLRSFAVNQLRTAAALRTTVLCPYERPLTVLALKGPAPTHDQWTLQSPWGHRAGSTSARSPTAMPCCPRQTPRTGIVASAITPPSNTEAARLRGVAGARRYRQVVEFPQLRNVVDRGVVQYHHRILAIDLDDQPEKIKGVRVVDIGERGIHP